MTLKIVHEVEPRCKAMALFAGRVIHLAPVMRSTPALKLVKNGYLERSAAQILRKQRLYGPKKEKTKCAR